MNSCIDTNIDVKKAMKDASFAALSSIYKNMADYSYNNDNLSNIYNNYKPDTTKIFQESLYNQEKAPEYNKKDTFNFLINNLDSATLLTNGSNNLFTIDENSNIYANCAATSANTWFTSSNIDKNINICTIDKQNIQLPSQLEFNQDKSLIQLNLKSKDPNKYAFCSHDYNINKAYCENNWYDWIITPNYYLGNTWFKDIGSYSENDIFKCYRPCEGDSLPYTTTKGEYKCLNKKYYENGIFSKKYMYSPIELINLIGNVAMYNTADLNKCGIYILHNLIINYKLNTNVDTEIYKHKNDIYNIINKYNALGDSEKSNIFQHYKDINTLFNNAIKNNILKNYTDDQYDYATNTKIFSYKNPLFNEDEPELYTLKGLDINNILIDPILLHTWLLANIFAPYDIDTIATNLDASINMSDNMDKSLFNKLVNSELLKNDTSKQNKAHRLKNIFFKAVNICYNNKTDFSKNIIKRTKDSFKTIIIINVDKYIDIYKEYIFNNKTIQLLLEKNALDNFKEIKYYEHYELCNYYKQFNQGSTVYLVTSGAILDTLNSNKYFYTSEPLEINRTCDNCKYDEYNICQKDDKPATNESEENNPSSKETSLNDEFQMPNLQYLLILFLRIVIVIIIIYILYIFSDIFGETFLVFINTIYVNIIESLYISYNELISSDYSEQSKYWRDKAYVTKQELENIKYKIKKMDNFRNTEL